MQGTYRGAKVVGFFNTMYNAVYAYNVASAGFANTAYYTPLSADGFTVFFHTEDAEAVLANFQARYPDEDGSVRVMTVEEVDALNEAQIRRNG